MNARERAEHWLAQKPEKEYVQEIKSMLATGDNLEDAFYKNLEFGTGGMRGIMGTGSNRVNRYTLGMATQGLCNYLKRSFPDQTVRVAIAYDCRNNSDVLARVVADVITGNGMHAYVFSALRPTPELSFAVRHLGCQSGIVITASHNPPEYNGYKVYWADGAQIIAPHDKAIVQEVNRISSFSEIKFKGNKSRLHWIDKDVDEAFLQASLAQRRTDAKSDLSIVFTPLHGTAITLMPELFARAGYANFHIVKAQQQPDGNFPTVKSPNPEEREALDMALKEAKKLKADVVIGTDPDSDRVGVAVRDAEGKMILLNGNQCGVLITDYLLRKEREARTLRPSNFIAYTIVSSDMFRDIALRWKCRYEVCLTGFKYIAELIRRHEGKHRFIGGGEESYGYMVGDFVRDKDALTSALIFCDMAAEAKEKGGSAFEELMELYKRHGFYYEELRSLTMKGKDGAEKIDAMMRRFRGEAPKTLGGEKVQVNDYSFGLRMGLDGSAPLPKSNVLEFRTSGGSKISARPSGTEPKIKFYFSVKSPWKEGATYDEMCAASKVKIESYVKDLGL